MKIAETQRETVNMYLLMMGKVTKEVRQWDQSAVHVPRMFSFQVGVMCVCGHPERPRAGCSLGGSRSWEGSWSWEGLTLAGDLGNSWALSVGR